MEKCYLLLGSNLGVKENNLNEARKYIETNIGNISKTSALYETEPVGFKHPELFLNQVVEIETMLKPEEVLELVLDIEKLLGRIRIGSGYQARVIDIDVLFHGKRIIEKPELILPHPRLHLRRFTLEPLNEIAPDFIHPKLNLSINQLFQSCPDSSDVKKLY